METFWFFWLRFRRAYDSAYDSDFLFSLGHKLSYDFDYDSDSDSVVSENQPLAYIHKPTEIDCSSVLKRWYACLHRRIILP